MKKITKLSEILDALYVDYNDEEKHINVTDFDGQKPIPAYPHVKFKIDLSEIMKKNKN